MRGLHEFLHEFLLAGALVRQIFNLPSKCCKVPSQVQTLTLVTACLCPPCAAKDMQQSAQNSWHRREVPLVVAADSTNPSTLSDYGERREPALHICRLLCRRGVAG